MATSVHSESRSLYSWWWDSHISPKNSKWLQENLTDMDAKIKAMIKLIEEDADSFARRAEMFYKKRPELMKLVEEFYRAYRALAERYDHATVELRQAHRTMAKAFPNQVPYILEDDSPSSSPGPGAEPHTPEMLLPIRALLDPASKESNSDISQRGLKRHNDMFGCVVPQHSKLADGKGLNVHEAEEVVQSFQDMSSQLSSEIQDIKTQVLSEFKRAGTAEIEVQTLKKTVVEMQAEKEAAFLQYQQCLEKLSNLERELNHAQKDVRELDGRASKEEIEIKILKEALEKLKAERDASLLQYSQCLKRISSLENMIFLAPEDAKALNERAVKAENEAENLKQELSKLEAEKEAGLLQYKQCREKISVLENKISLAEENAKMLNEQSERAETEVKALKEAVAKLNEEREFAALKYDQCLETIAKKESEIAHAREDAKRLNSEILIGAAKLESAEAQYVLLEQSHQSLRLEADNLAQKIAMKDQELSEKHDELQKLQLLVQEEHSQFLQVEATLQTMQKLHSQSQDEQRDLVLELKNGLQILKDLEMCRERLEKEIHQVKEENCSLNELNFSSTVSIKNLQDEIFSLKETKEKLDDQVAVQVDQSNALQQEIFHLKKEIGDLNRRYRALMEQVESVGLNPECLDSSVKDLQDENSKLKEVCKRDRDEREALYEKLKNMEELSKKNAVLDSSLSELYRKLEGAQEKVEELQGSCQLLQGEKSTFVSEKATMVSQLHIITENMQKLLENNTFLEDSLSGANVELEVLRTKSKSLEELCQLLNNEKSNLLIERDTLASQLGNAEQRLGNLEKRFSKLEEKYAGLEKEKDSTLCQLEELRGSLGAEKRKHADFMHSSEARMAGLENRVPLLQGESRLTRKFFEEELNKAVNDQIEMFLLQKFVEDLEEQNFSLLIDCQRHVEASKLSDKLISELESENLEQQVEAEFLLDDLERLRKGIHQVFQALQIEPDNGHEKVEQEQTLLPQILKNVEYLKGEILRNKDEKQQLLIENSVLLTLLGQLKIESAELESENRFLEQKCKMTTEQCSILQNDKCELLEMNRQLRLEVSEGDQRGEVLKAEMGSLRIELLNSQRAFMVVQEEKLTVLEENISLLKGISDLKQEKDLLKEENGAFLYEAVAFEYLSFVSNSFGNEKVAELKALTEDLNSLHLMNSDLKEEVGILEEKLQMKETENLHLSESLQKTDKELHEVKDSNDQLSHQIIIENEFLRQKAMELSEAEQKLRTSQNLSVELSRTIEQLKRELEQSKLLGENAEKQILELSENNTNQSKEMECLLNVNENLVSELGILHKKIEEHRIREENLSSDLRERSNEFEVWEAEAATFFFDFQISAVHEVLLENKVQELTRVCESLEDISATGSVETEKMKERVGFLESEIRGLKAQLFAYAPLIASLRDDIASLEHNALLRTKHRAEDNQEQQGVETAVHHGRSYQELREDQSATVQDGISDLQKMQARVKAVERAVVEEMELIAKHEGVNTTTISPEPEVKETERLSSKCLSRRDQDMAEEQIGIGDEPTDYPKSQKTKPGVPATRNGILMKDIQLDQVSDCSSYKTSKRRDGGGGDQIIKLRETDEQDYNPDQTVNETQKEASVPSEDGIICCQFEDVEQKSQDLSSELQTEKELGVDKLEISTTSVVEPNLEGNKRKFLERLASDAQKLTSLQTTVQELKRKTEINKKSEKGKDAKYESVKRQLEEVEEAVVQLVDANNQLRKDIEESPSYFNGKTSVEVEEARNVDRKRVTERARGGSEKIGRLQFEVQNIQYVLLKLEDAKKSSESRTSILLRDFISNSRRIGKRRREKGRFCWCMKPSTNGD